jgi:hypothetical protein
MPVRHPEAILPGNFAHAQSGLGSPIRAAGQIMPRVQLSMMTFVDYDEDAAELDITFTSGKTYRYLNVPLEIHVDLLDAESRGEYFNDNIKDAFLFAEVTSGRRG